MPEESRCLTRSGASLPSRLSTGESASRRPLLSIDIGNTTCDFALMDGGQRLAGTRVSTHKPHDRADFERLVSGLLDSAAATGAIDGQGISGAVVCSVVPSMTIPVAQAVRGLGLSLVRVDPARGRDWGITLPLDNPRELGEDLFADITSVVLAGREARNPADPPSPPPTLIVDCGTATKFILVEDRALAGLIIAPGVRMGADALTVGTAQLPSIDLVRPQRLFGLDTISCMQSGVYYGSVGMIGGIIGQVSRERKESGKTPVRVVATGGYSRLFETENLFDRREPLLIHRGIEEIGRREGL